LAAVALPAYQNYMVKSKLVEATTTLDAAKIAINEGYAGGVTANTWPVASAIQPLGQNAKYVSVLTYTPGTSSTNGSIVVTLGNTGNSTVDGKFLGLIGIGKTDGTISWTCSTLSKVTDVAAGAVTALYPYIPASCQS
jgi:type IV pilus assembly protein PilA